MDKEGEAVMAEFFAAIDTTVMGRKTAVVVAKMRKSGEIPGTPGMATYVVPRRRWSHTVRRWHPGLPGQVPAARLQADRMQVPLEWIGRAAL